MTQTRKIWITIWLLLLPFKVVIAQESSGLPFGPIISEQALTSFAIVGTGARALGMGGAFTSLADDASAASFNPAGLAQITIPEVSFVGQRSDLTDGYLDFTSYDQVLPLPLTDSSIKTSSDSFNFFSVTLPFTRWDHRWSAQISSHEIVNLNYLGARSLEETDNAGVPLFELKQSAANTGQIDLLSGSISLQASPRTLLGITINRWDGKWRYLGTFSEFPVGAPELMGEFTYLQHNRLKGWNFDAGILLKYEHFNFGIRYRSPADLDYSLEAEIQTIGITTARQPVDPTQTRLRWPSSITVGLSWQATDRFVLSTDWGHTDWTKMNFEFATLGERNFFDMASPANSAASPADDYHVGAEYIVVGSRGLMPLRIGWALVPQPAPDSVTGERITTETVAGGLGFKRNWFSVDLTYSLNKSNTLISRFVEPDDIADGGLAANSSGRLDRKESMITLSFIIQFSQGSPLRRALRNIFVGPE